MLFWDYKVGFLDCSNNTVGANKVLDVTTRCVLSVKKQEARTTKGVVLLYFSFFLEFTFQEAALKSFLT